MIYQKCLDNLQLGCDTVDLVIDRPREEAEFLAPDGPRGEVLVPYIKDGVQRGWVVNFKISEVLHYLQSISRELPGSDPGEDV